jgi:hypothetical protein
VASDRARLLTVATWPERMLAYSRRWCGPILRRGQTHARLLAPVARPTAEAVARQAYVFLDRDVGDEVICSEWKWGSRRLIFLIEVAKA